MNVLLINPHWSSAKGSIWKEVRGNVLPVGLGILAACLEKAGHAVTVLDASALQMSVEELRSFLRKQPFDYAGITATTFTVTGALKIAGICKEMRPAAKVVMGGVHPTIYPDEMLASPHVDYVIRGEGEEAIVELISKGPDATQNVSYRAGGTPVHNPMRPLIDDLDALPMPAYHLFPMEKYFPAAGGYRRLPAVNMITSRGCPGNCTFCYKEMFGRKTRMRSAASLVAEIRHLVSAYGIKEITFYDDTFTVSKPRVKEFCDLLLKEKIDLTWSCMSRIDSVDGETLRAMRAAGCHQICYGIESADDTVLQNIKKPLSLTKATEIARITKKAGITLRMSFMLGNPGETKETMAKTLAYAVRVGPNIAQFNITTPYPGSDMFRWAKENKYLNTEDWQKYDLAHMVMDLPTVPSRRVEEFYRYAYKKFYFRPGYLLFRLVNSLRPSELRMNIRTFFKIVKMLLTR